MNSDINSSFSHGSPANNNPSQEQVALEEMFSIPPMEQGTQRIEALHNARTITQGALDNAMDAAESAYLERRIATLQEMLAHSQELERTNSDDWDGSEATMQIDVAQGTSHTTEDWDRAEATLHNMPTQQTTNDSEDWDGTEATLQNIATNNPVDNWDGSEATLQNMPTRTGQEDWDGNEVTLQGIPAGAQLRDADKEATNPTLTKPVGSGSSTDLTLINENSKQKTRGTSTRGLDAGWHLAGRKGPATGETWGDYEIGGVLGEGGMGLVYRARQSSLNRKCAVKVLAPHLAADDRVRERFELEAQTTSLLNSPNIVNVFAAGAVGDNNYFVMEYVEGQDLGDSIKDRAKEDKHFTCDEATEIIIQAARGLCEAGRHGIVHRDIKPGNLMVSKKNEIKIADFGIVKVMGESSLTMTGQAVGTPSYLSPEQGRGDEVDQRSDLYSLGVVFYQLITGQRPFDGTTPNALIYQHNFEEPQAPKEIDSSISDEIQAVVIKLLSKKAENRYADADHLVDDLHKIQEGIRLEALLAEKLSTGAEEARKENLSWAQRNLLKVVSGIAASLLCIGGYAWYQYDSNARAAEERQNKSAQLAQERQIIIDDLKVKRGDLKKYLDVANDIPLALNNDLDSFALLVNTYPDLANSEDPKNISLWRKKIRAVDALKNDLRFLDQLDQLDRENKNGYVSYDLRLPASIQLSTLKTLIGSHSEDVVRWHDIIERSETFILATQHTLTQVDSLKNNMTALQRHNLQRLFDQLTGLVENNENPDANMNRWKSVFAAFDLRTTHLEKSLSTLSEQDIVLTEMRRIHYQRDLDQLSIIRGAQDPMIVGYQNILSLAADEVSRLHKDLTRLKPSNTLRISVVEALALSTKLERLTELQSISVRQKNIYSKRLEDEKSLREDLRIRLRILDQAVPIENYRSNIREFYTRVGKDDADALRWHTKLQEIDDLKAQLAHVHDIIPLRDDARKNLTQLTRKVGSNDSDVIAWTQKINRVEQYLQELSALDQVRVINPQAIRTLEQLKKDIGNNDQRILRWGKKIADVNTLKTTLRKVPGTTLLSVAELKSQLHNLKALVSNIGLNDAELTTWAQQLSLLRGPGRPRWASNFGRDNFGLWAEMRIAHATFSTVNTDSTTNKSDALATFKIDPDANMRIEGDTRLNDDNSVAIRFRFIPAGNFMQGAGAYDSLRDADETQILSTISASYWIADSEVTQAVWQNIMGSNPSKFKNARNPVERINFHDCQKFIVNLNSQYPLLPARLPSEAEWERACKGGNTEVIYAGPQGKIADEKLGDIAWHKDNALGKTHITGVRQPNNLGLHDMHGNVWEWCQDGYNEYPTQDAVDHIGIGEKNVARGGSWGDQAYKLRSSNRLEVNPTMKSSYLGLRLAVDARWNEGHEPDGKILLAQANEVFEQFQIDQHITSNIRLFVQIEWPKVSNYSDTNETFEDFILAPSLKENAHTDPALNDLSTDELLQLIEDEAEREQNSVELKSEE